MSRFMHLRGMLPLLAVLLLTGGLPAAHAARAAPPAAPQDVPGNVVPDGGFESRARAGKAVAA